MVLENLCGGATRLRKKLDDIFIRFDRIPAVTDGHVVVAKTAPAERRAGINSGKSCTFCHLARNCTRFARLANYTEALKQPNSKDGRLLERRAVYILCTAHWRGHFLLQLGEPVLSSCSLWFVCQLFCVFFITASLIHLCLFCLFFVFCRLVVLAVL